MGKILSCPCGEPITGLDDEFVDKVNAHLSSQHEGRTYPAEAILMMASEYDDAKITG